jgi:hypothetical protein
VYGPRGLFHVRLSGVEIVGAGVNEYGLHQQAGQELAEDATAALRAATGPIV